MIMHGLSFKIESIDLDQVYPYCISIHLNVFDRSDLLGSFYALNSSARDLLDELTRQDIKYQLVTNSSAYDHSFRLKSNEDLVMAKLLWETL